MITRCSFSRQIWAQLETWIGTTMQPLPRNTYHRLQEWWTSVIATGMA
jgi:hypothetical protein